MKTINRTELNSEYKNLVNGENFPTEYEAHGYYCYCNFGGYIITLSNDVDACIIVGDLGGDTVSISDILEIEYLPDEENNNDLEPTIRVDGMSLPLYLFVRA